MLGTWETFFTRLISVLVLDRFTTYMTMHVLLARALFHGIPQWLPWY